MSTAAALGTNWTAHFSAAHQLLCPTVYFNQKHLSITPACHPLSIRTLHSCSTSSSSTLHSSPILHSIPTLRSSQLSNFPPLTAPIQFSAPHQTCAPNQFSVSDHFSICHMLLMGKRSFPLRGGRVLPPFLPPCPIPMWMRFMNPSPPRVALFPLP